MKSWETASTWKIRTLKKKKKMLMGFYFKVVGEDCIDCNVMISGSLAFRNDVAALEKPYTRSTKVPIIATRTV